MLGNDAATCPECKSTNINLSANQLLVCNDCGNERTGSPGDYCSKCGFSWQEHWGLGEDECPSWKWV